MKKKAMSIYLNQIQEDFENEKQPGESFIDWLKSKPDSYFKRIELNKGGKVISISDYLKQKEDIPIKKIDLASYFTPGKTLSSLTEAEVSESAESSVSSW